MGTSEAAKFDTAWSKNDRTGWERGCGEVGVVIGAIVGKPRGPPGGGPRGEGHFLASAFSGSIRRRALL